MVELDDPQAAALTTFAHPRRDRRRVRHLLDD
jgi:hypothetical protein